MGSFSKRKAITETQNGAVYHKTRAIEIGASVTAMFIKTKLACPERHRPSMYHFLLKGNFIIGLYPWLFPITKQMIAPTTFLQTL